MGTNIPKLPIYTLVYCLLFNGDEIFTQATLLILLKKEGFPFLG